MIPRYSRPEMRAIWTDENKLNLWLRIEMLAAEALKIMEDHKINALVVVDDQDNPVGALNMHDLLRAGVM